MMATILNTGRFASEQSNNLCLILFSAIVWQVNDCVLLFLLIESIHLFSLVLLHIYCLLMDMQVGGKCQVHCRCFYKILQVNLWYDDEMNRNLHFLEILTSKLQCRVAWYNVILLRVGWTTAMQEENESCYWYELFSLCIFIIWRLTKLALLIVYLWALHEHIGLISLVYVIPHTIDSKVHAANISENKNHFPCNAENKKICETHAKTSDVYTNDRIIPALVSPNVWLIVIGRIV